MVIHLTSPWMLPGGKRRSPELELLKSTPSAEKSERKGEYHYIALHTCMHALNFIKGRVNNSLVFVDKFLWCGWWSFVWYCAIFTAHCTRSWSTFMRCGWSFFMIMCNIHSTCTRSTFMSLSECMVNLKALATWVSIALRTICRWYNMCAYIMHNTQQHATLQCNLLRAVPLIIIIVTESGLVRPPWMLLSWAHTLISSPSSPLPVEFSSWISAPEQEDIRLCVINSVS